MTQTDRAGEYIPRHRQFVWWSSESSVRTGIPSVLATLEVIVSVVTYLGIAIYFETFTHLWVSICVAPLLLLRSDQSIALGARWFDAYIERFEFGTPSFNSLKFWIATIPVLLASTMLAYVLANRWTLNLSPQHLFWAGAAIQLSVFSLSIATVVAIFGWNQEEVYGGGIAALVAGIAGITASGAGYIAVAGAASAILSVSMVAMLFWAINVDSGFEVTIGGAVLPGFALGIWLRSVILRFAATACHFRAGFWEIPRNFIHTLFIVDFRHPAELMPGFSKNQMFTSNGLLHSFRKEKTLVIKLLDGIALVIFFIPAYAYRLSIKSTCWLYLPLVYIANIRDFVSTPMHLFARLATPREWLRRGLALVTIVGFLVTSFVHNPKPELSDFFGPKLVSPLEYFILIDMFALTPWQLCSLLSASITAYLFLRVGEIRVDHTHLMDAAGRIRVSRAIERLKLLMRLRNVFSLLLILIVGIHALLTFSPVIRWLPSHVLRGLSWFYGSKYIPPLP